jgi:RND family efflux transporter MFP subunit
MRNFIYVTILAFAVAACQKPNELDAAKAELKTLQDEQKDIEKQIGELTQKIAKLDTTKEVVNRTLVTLTKPEKGDFVYKIQVPGAADSRQNIVVSAESMGNITNIYVQEGSMVTKGQTIATIDSEVMSRQIAELQTRLDFATEMFEKQERLWEQKIGSEVQYLQAKNNKESIEQSIKSLKAQASKSRITAPISGYLDEVFVRIGQTVAMGTPAVRIVDLKNIVVTADVSEKYIGTITTKDSIQIKFPSIDKAFTAKVSMIGQVVNSDNRTFTVEAEIKNVNGEIKPNILADVTIPVYQNDAAMLIPTSVIQQGKTNDFVFLAVEENGGLTAKKQTISIGRSYKGQTEVFEGIDENAKLVDLGSKGLANGEPLKVD